MYLRAIATKPMRDALRVIAPSLFVAVVMLMFGSRSQASAQVVELRLREASSGAPIGGAIVRLMAESRTVFQGLTNAAGFLILSASGPGTYRLRIDRIGWSGLLTDSVQLEVGQTHRMIVPMASTRVELPGVVVRGKSRCDASAQTGAVAGMLWEEIHKALTANVITTSSRLVPLHVREFLREVSRDNDPVREWVTVSKIVRGQPFGSPSASVIASSGFVREVGDSAVFEAPDAALLLSDDFVATHCCEAVPVRNGLVGLAFEPIPRRKLPEVSGTIWIDRGSGELRFLEYSYTGLAELLRPSELGGRIDFSRLPTGPWIVSYWHIRMPRVVTTTEYVRDHWREVTRLAGFIDRGGRAEVVSDTTGRIHRAIIRGRVFDSLTGGGLPGAFIGVRGTTDSIISGGDGRFEMAVAVSGHQVITARHPKLELLGERPERGALLSLGDTTSVQFAVPPIRAFRESLCQGSRGEAGILGSVRGSDGTPAVEQEVRVTWRSPPPRPTVLTRTTRSNRRGLYGLCDLPSHVTLPIRMAKGMITLYEYPVLLELGELRWVDLREWGSADTTALRLPSSVMPGRSSTSTGGRSIVIGIVRDSMSGGAIEGAVVRVEQRRDSALTDAFGRFTLATDTLGSQLISVEHASLGRLDGETSTNVMLSVGDTTEISFSVVPTEAVLNALCGSRRSGASLLGIASGASGAPEAGLVIRLRWRVASGMREVSGRTISKGVFAFCGLPPDSPIGVELLAGNRSLSLESVRLAKDETKWANLGAR